MLITATGRKTGKSRNVMVDVMDYDKTTDTYYIEAAYGALSNEGAGEMPVQYYRHKPA